MSSSLEYKLHKSKNFTQPVLSSILSTEISKDNQHLRDKSPEEWLQW